MRPLNLNEDVRPSCYFKSPGISLNLKKEAREWLASLIQSRRLNSPGLARKFDGPTIHNIRTASGKLIQISAKYKIPPSVGYASKIRRGLRRVG